MAPILGQGANVSQILAEFPAGTLEFIRPTSGVKPMRQVLQFRIRDLNRKFFRRHSIDAPSYHCDTRRPILRNRVLGPETCTVQPLKFLDREGHCRLGVAKQGHLETYFIDAFVSLAAPKEESFYLCPNTPNATPVIDKKHQLIYTIAADGRLYGLDLATGGVKFGPFAIRAAGMHPSTGDGRRAAWE